MSPKVVVILTRRDFTRRSMTEPRWARAVSASPSMRSKSSEPYVSSTDTVPVTRALADAQRDAGAVVPLDDHVAEPVLDVDHLDDDVRRRVDVDRVALDGDVGQHGRRGEREGERQEPLHCATSARTTTSCRKS